MARTVLLHVHCPISAEIRTVDSQSNLRILFIVFTSTLLLEELNPIEHKCIIGFTAGS